MKKFISLLIVVVLLFSCSMTVFASDSTASDSNNLKTNKILNELNKITDKADQDKVTELLSTPFYGVALDGEITPVDDTDLLIDTIQNLNKFSGKELDKQIAKLLKSTIDSKLKDPEVCFTEDAVLLVDQYCPEQNDKIKSRTETAIAAEKEASASIAAATPWTQYVRSKSYQWRNIGGVLLYYISLTIDWGTDGLGNIAYSSINSKSYDGNPSFNFWECWLDSSITNYTTYCKAVQESCYYVYATRAMVFPTITVKAYNDGSMTATGNTVN